MGFVYIFSRYRALVFYKVRIEIRTNPNGVYDKFNCTHKHATVMTAKSFTWNKNIN